MRKLILCACTLYVYINLIFANDFKIKYKAIKRIWKLKFPETEEIKPLAPQSIKLGSTDMFIFLQINPSTQDKSIYYWVGNSTETDDRQKIAYMTAKLWQEVKKVSISKEDNKLPTISRETQCQESANFQVHFGPLVNISLTGKECVTTELYEIQWKNQNVIVDLVTPYLNDFNGENGYVLYENNTIKYHEPSNEMIREVVQKIILKVWEEKCNKIKKPHISSETMSSDLPEKFKKPILQKQKSFKETLQSIMKMISCMSDNSVDVPIEKQSLLKSQSLSNRISGSGKQLLESVSTSQQKRNRIYTVENIDNKIILKPDEFQTMRKFINKTCLVNNKTYNYLFVYIGYESSLAEVKFALQKGEQNSNTKKIIVVVNEEKFVPICFWTHFPDFVHYLINDKFPAQSDNSDEEPEPSHAY